MLRNHAYGVSQNLDVACKKVKDDLEKVKIFYSGILNLKTEYSDAPSGKTLCKVTSLSVTKILESKGLATILHSNPTQDNPLKNYPFYFIQK